MPATIPYCRADAHLAPTASNGGHRYSAWVRVPGRSWERVGPHGGYGSEAEAEEATIGAVVCSDFLVASQGFDPNVTAGELT